LRFSTKLFDEFGIEAVAPPKVPYHITYLPAKHNNLKEAYTEIIEDLKNWPSFGQKFSVQEPIVQVRIMASVEHTPVLS
jgi:translation elongation factor EF-4